MVLLIPFGFVRDDRAAPIEPGDGAPGLAVTDAFFLLRDAVHARLQRLAPAQTGIDQIMFPGNTWPPGSPGDNRLQFFGAHDRAQAMSGGVIVVVDQHSGTNQILARWTYGADASVLMTAVGTQHSFGVSNPFAPDAARVAQLYVVFADVEISRALCCS